MGSFLRMHTHRALVEALPHCVGLVRSQHVGNKLWTNSRRPNAAARFAPNDVSVH